MSSSLSQHGTINYTSSFDHWPISRQTYHMVLDGVEHFVRDGDVGDLLSQVTAGNSGLNRS